MTPIITSGWSNNSNQVIVDTTPPTAPGRPQVTPSLSYDGSVSISWSPSSDSGGSGLSNYLLQRRKVGAWRWTTVSYPSGSPCSESNLENGQYEYQVKAVDRAGNYSSPSPLSASCTVAASEKWANGQGQGGTKKLGQGNAGARISISATPKTGSIDPLKITGLVNVGNREWEVASLDIKADSSGLRVQPTILGNLIKPPLTISSGLKPRASKTIPSATIDYQFVIWIFPVYVKGSIAPTLNLGGNVILAPSPITIYPDIGAGVTVKVGALLGFKYLGVGLEGSLTVLLINTAPVTPGPTRITISDHQVVCTPILATSVQGELDIIGVAGPIDYNYPLWADTIADFTWFRDVTISLSW